MGMRRAIAAALTVLTVGLTMLLGAGAASAAPADVPTSNVTGPIAATPDSYPYLATDIDLGKYGYVE